MDETILQRWEISESELTQLVDDNPSLRGYLQGYVAERKLWSKFLGRVDAIRKPADHDRAERYDLAVEYRGHEFTVEAKSVRPFYDKGRGTVGVRVSDQRKVKLPNGRTVNTTSIIRGTFDLLAVSMLSLLGRWSFAFALERTLPDKNTGPRKDREFLLPTSIPITYPLSEPFTDDPFILLDKLVEERT